MTHHESNVEWKDCICNLLIIDPAFLMNEAPWHNRLQRLLIVQKGSHNSQYTIWSYCFSCSSAFQNSLWLSVHHLEFGDFSVGTLWEWNQLIQNPLGVFKDLFSPTGVVIISPDSPFVFRNNIGAVDRIEKTSPPYVCSIQSLTGITKWHQKLWPCNLRDFRIHVFGADLKKLSLGYQLSDWI